MAKTETANYTTERTKLQTSPVYFCQFRHVKAYGDGTDYAFSRDFATGTVASPVVTKLPYLLTPAGSLQTVDHENGRSSIGSMSFRFLDVGGELLKYLSAPALTLKTAMTATSPTVGGFVELNEDPGGLPAVGTIEITTAGAIERVRYDLVDTALDRVRVATSGRGADATTAAAHSIGDPIGNGEQIRPGQRCQLYAGYGPLAEADYMAFAKMEVVRRALLPDGLTYQVDLADIQRSIRRAVFLTAAADAPTTLIGNPITSALRVLSSTGTAPSGYAAGTWDGANFADDTQDATDFGTSAETDFTLFDLTNGHGWSAGASAPWDGCYVEVTEANAGGSPVFAREYYNGASWATLTLTATPSYTATGETYLRWTRPGDWASATPAGYPSAKYWMRERATTAPTTTGAKARRVIPFGTNGPYDWGPAVNGLGVPEALLDLSGLEALRVSEFPSDVFDFLITATADGKTWVEDEIWKALNCYPRITQDGKYGAKRYKITGSPVKTLTRSDIIAWAWSLSDQGIINVVDFEYDWNLVSAKERYGKQQIYSHTGTGSSIEKYGSRAPMKIRSQGIKTAFGGQTLLDDRALQVIRRFAEPVSILTLDILYQNHHLEVGDQVNVTHDLIPNAETGLRGITAQAFEIINLQPMFGGGGKVRVTLLDPPPTASAPTSGGATTTPDVISDDLVTTASVQDNAITADGIDTVDAETAVTTTEAAAGTVVISTDGGQGVLWGKAMTRGSVAGTVRLRLRKDSVTGTVLDDVLVVTTTSYSGFPVFLMGRDTSPVGSQTYVLTVQAGSNDQFFKNMRLYATNLKR